LHQKIVHIARNRCRNDFLSIEQIVRIHYLVIGTFACGEVKKTDRRAGTSEMQSVSPWRPATFEINKRAMGKIQRWQKLAKITKESRSHARHVSSLAMARQKKERKRERLSLLLYISYYCWKSEIQLISQLHSRRCRCNYDCPTLAPAATLMKFSINRGCRGFTRAKRMSDTTFTGFEYSIEVFTQPIYESKLRIRTNWI